MGKSYRQIEKELDIARSTLSGWFKGKQWSEQIKNKLETINAQNSDKRITRLAKINKARNEKRRMSWRKSAKDEFFEFFDNKLFIAGLMIYDGEGDKVAKMVWLEWEIPILK